LQTSARDAFHHPAKAGRKGHGVDGRRSGSTKSPSFDEAAVEASLALPLWERDRGRQRLVCDRPRGRIRHREGAPVGRLSIKSLQVRAVLVPLGNRGTSTAMPKLESRRQARLYPRSRRSPKLRLGERPWKPPSKAKAEAGGDSGVERFTGCSCCNVGCRDWVDGSSLLGQSAPKGGWRHLRVA